jgi:ubiquinone biosynthesis protein COQ9
MTTDAAEATPDWAEAAEARVLEAACRLADTGLRWDRTLARRAAAEAGLSEADAALLLPQGASDLAALLWRRHDRAAMQALAAIDPKSLKVRERIAAGALARVEAAMADRAAVQASALYLARPDRAALALRLGWDSADAIWRWAGDTATDENHYSKRALLGAILASTLAVRLARGPDAAQDQLERAIAGVMRFETWKAKLPPLTPALTIAAASLGRLRYGRSAPADASPPD